MTSIKDAIKNWEVKEAKKAADAGLPEPPKASDAERVMLYISFAAHLRFIPYLTTLIQVRAVATDSKNG